MLAAYQRKNKVDDVTIAEQLHCEVSDLGRLRLCRVPRPDHFDEDVECIASRFHADAMTLAQVLREP